MKTNEFMTHNTTDFEPIVRDMLRGVLSFPDWLATYYNVMQTAKAINRLSKKVKNA